MGRADLTGPDSTSDDWWDERLAAMESVLGRSDGWVSHATVPFFLGYDVGGRADVVHFREHLAGIVYATCDLIGCGDQIPNSLGNYELTICHRSAETWGISVINQLAYYTLKARLEPGETMDIRSATQDSPITAFLFAEFGRFTVRDQSAGLLLCIGITSDELDLCRSGRRSEVEAALKSKKVYPFTELQRRSVLVGRKE